MSALAGQLLSLIHRRGGRATIDEIGAEQTGRAARQQAFKALDGLIDEGILVKRKTDGYSFARPNDIVAGPISIHPKGFAFAETGSGEVFVPPGETGSARHGDTVLLLITARGKESPVARVIAVLARTEGLLTGIYLAGTPSGVVEPDDERYPFRLIVRRENAMDAADGTAVVARLLPGEAEAGFIEAKIVEVLGDAERLAVQTELVVRKLDLPAVFDDAVLAEAEALDGRVMLTAGRLDLRDVPHITIDGETARDFDDAVALEKSGDNWLLHVSIADVSHYVTPGSAIDREAYRRGTSVYFPDRVLPMLPERLSNDLCSLVPHVDRYAFSAILRFDSTGRLLDHRFVKSVINSRHRMTYTTVAAIVVDRDEASRARYHDICPMLDEMAAFGAVLEQRRRRRGAIGFEIPEASIVLDEESRVADIGHRQRNQAHRIIESFMLAANEAVAEYAAGQKSRALAAFLYRIHEAPDPAKVQSFFDFAASLGLATGEPGEEPAWFGRILDKVLGTPREYIISNLMLRVMQQARYAPHNAGHFGLAAPFYTHFTSPIRRYPDLLVHRSLAALEKLGPQPEKTDAEAMGEHLSQRERLAVDAEREIMDRAKVLYLQHRIGETFRAIVSGVSSFGIFVELIDHYVSGAVNIADLTDDYYTVDEKMHRLYGRRSGRTYQIGDQVTVRLVSVVRRRRHINFVIEEE
ncbi:MAG: ribonuclease R [Thermodesulfobacteriota bacterium]